MLAAATSSCFCDVTVISDNACGLVWLAHIILNPSDLTGSLVLWKIKILWRQESRSHDKDGSVKGVLSVPRRLADCGTAVLRSFLLTDTFPFC
jgi:hypothetical protein